MNLKKKKSINLYIILILVIIPIIFFVYYQGLKSKIKDDLVTENQINLTEPLNDGKYWYNGSDYRLPFELIIQFNRVYNVFSVNFFLTEDFPNQNKLTFFI